jgi:hypothetical protein
LVNKHRLKQRQQQADQLRLDFEQWLLTTEWADIRSPVCTERRPERPGTYWYAHVDLAWRAYQAMHSRLRQRAHIVHRAMGEPELSWNRHATSLRDAPLYILKKQKGPK